MILKDTLRKHSCHNLSNRHVRIKFSVCMCMLAFGIMGYNATQIFYHIDEAVENISTIYIHQAG